MQRVKIQYLSDHPELAREIAGYWCREWSSRSDEAAVDRKTVQLTGATDIIRLPLYLVATQDGQLVGTGAIFEHDLTGYEHLTPWLGGMYTLEFARGQGIATQMVARLIKEAKRLGHTRLYLHTETAATLYEKLGWSLLEKLETATGVTSRIYYLDI